MLIKKLKRKSGLTLVELLVTISLMGLVIGIASSIFLGNNKIFKKGVDQYDVQSNARIAMTDITNSVRYATFIEILPDTATIPEADTIADNEGYIYYDSAAGDIVHRTKSSNFTQTIGTAEGSGITFTACSGEFTLGISIMGTDDNKKFEVASSVLCLNMQLYSTMIDGEGSGSKIHYRKNLASLVSTPEVTVTASPSASPSESPSVEPSITIAPLNKITLSLTQTKNGYGGNVNFVLIDSTIFKIYDIPQIDITATNCGNTTIGKTSDTNIGVEVNSPRKDCIIMFDFILGITNPVRYKCTLEYDNNSKTWTKNVEEY